MGRITTLFWLRIIGALDVHVVFASQVIELLKEVSGFSRGVPEGRRVTLAGFSRGLHRSNQTLPKLRAPSVGPWTVFRTRKLQVLTGWPAIS